MSTQSITFRGEDLARMVPALGEFVERYSGKLMTLEDLQACLWAAGADDEVTKQAVEAVASLIGDYVVPIMVALGMAVGVQGDKLHGVRQLGDHTEATNAEAGRR